MFKSPAMKFTGGTMRRICDERSNVKAYFVSEKTRKDSQLKRHYFPSKNWRNKEEKYNLMISILYYSTTIACLPGVASPFEKSDSKYPTLTNIENNNKFNNNPYKKFVTLFLWVKMYFGENWFLFSPSIFSETPFVICFKFFYDNGNGFDWG